MQSNQGNRLLGQIFPGANGKRRQPDLDHERLPSSAEWFLKDQRTRDWLDGRGAPLLWGFGPAATGKTFISSALAYHIKYSKDSGRVALATIYLDRDDQQRIVADFGSASIMRQLVAQLPASSDILLDISKANDPPIFTWFEQLGWWRKIGTAFDQIFVILDSLNACSTEALNGLLAVLIGQNIEMSRFRIFVTSRQESEPSVGNCKVSLIKVRASDEDLRSWILHQISNPGSQTSGQTKDTSYEGQVVAEAIHLLDGRFLPLPWKLKPAALLEFIRECSGLAAAENRTATLCGRMASAIERFEGGDVALQILSLLFTANAFGCVLLVTDAIEILSHLGIRQASGRPYTEKIIMQLQDFGLFQCGLESREMRIQSPILDEYGPLLNARRITSSMIARASMRFLSQDAFRKGACPSSAELKMRFQSYPFLSYASLTLSCHLFRSNPREIISDFLKFASDSGCIDTYLQAARAWPYHNVTFYEELEGSEERWDIYPRGFEPLHLAAHIGPSDYVIDALVEQGCNISACTDSGQTALHIAVDSDASSDIVLALLRHKIDMSVADKFGDTALSIAVEQDQPRNTELLIQNGALLYGPSGNELLALAKEMECDEVVKTLVKCGVVSESDVKGFLEQ